MTKEVLASSIDGVYRELLQREKYLDSAWWYYHKHGYRGRLLAFYKRAVKVIRERNKLRAIIADLTYLLNNQNNRVQDFAPQHLPQQTSIAMTTETKNMPDSKPYKWLDNALTKEQLYNQIGQCNLKILQMEHRIPELEDMLNNPIMQEEPENAIAIQQSLRESRNELEELQHQVLKCRRTLIGRLEIELERVNRDIATAHPNWNEGEQVKYEIEKELHTLRKLVTA